MYDSTNPSNAVNVLLKDLQNHKVKVRVEADLRRDFQTEAEFEDRYLIILRAKTNLAEEFLNVYSVAAEYTEQLAKKLFGPGEAVCEYGALLDEELKIVYAFNCLFADYDFEQCGVVFKTADQVLAEQLERLMKAGLKPNNDPEGLRDLPHLGDFPNNHIGPITYYGVFPPDGFPDNPDDGILEYGVFPPTVPPKPGWPDGPSHAIALYAVFPPRKPGSGVFRYAVFPPTAPPVSLGDDLPLDLGQVPPADMLKPLNDDRPIFPRTLPPRQTIDHYDKENLSD